MKLELNDSVEIVLYVHFCIELNMIIVKNRFYTELILLIFYERGLIRCQNEKIKASSRLFSTFIYTFMDLSIE